MKTVIRILLFVVISSCLLCPVSLASDGSLNSPTANWLSPDDYESRYMKMAKYSYDLYVAERNLENAKNDKSVKSFQNGEWVLGPDSRNVEKAQEAYDFHLDAYNRAHNTFYPLDEGVLSVAVTEYRIRKSVEDYKESNPSQRTSRIYDGNRDMFVWVNPDADRAIEEYNAAISDFHTSLESLGYHSTNDAQIISLDSTDIKSGDFDVSCKLVCFDSDINDLSVILATYDRNGRFVSHYVVPVTSDDWSEFSDSFHVENDNLNINSFSVMLVDNESFSPVCDSLSIGR